MSGLYEVWCATGDGLVQGPKFRFLSDAEHYVQEHRGDGMLAIRTPDRKWIKYRAGEVQERARGTR